MKSLSPNSTLSHYRIIEMLGAGGMGEVWLAEDIRLKRRVALKLLPSELVADLDRIRRFEQEAQAASALNHPNILTVFDIGSDAGARFMTTEFVDGRTLRQEMSSGQPGLGQILDKVIQTAAALAAAHEAGITHRDIKPENVMVRQDGIVKVLDFGLAKLTEGDANSNIDRDAATLAKLTTEPGMVMGTPQYMSPEQARGQKVDGRSDVFSLGVMLYEMLAGRVPFEGVNAVDVISSILHKDPLPLKEGPIEVPAELQRIVLKTLRKDKSERYQTARDLLNDLKDLREGLSSQSKQTQLAQVEGGSHPTISSGAASPTVPQSSARIILGEIKRQKMVVVGAVFLFLLAAGFLSFYLRSGTGQIKSLAVLPFQNRSADADSEYLSDGLAESLILRLSQLPDLKISPTSSVFRYKGKETDPKKVAEELGVDAVMTGRLSQRGDELSITVELVDARNNQLLWGDRFERKLAELLSTQREIAAEIVSKLKLKLSNEGEQKLAKNYTTNPEAYQLFLKGRYQWNKRTVESLQEAVGYFQQAIAKDSKFALAYSGLAETYVLFPNYSLARPVECMPKAKEAALRAIELDDTLAETRTALGIYYSNYAWNFPAAEREFRRAIELNPKYAAAHQQYGIECLTAMKRFDEAIAESRKAVELDPVSLVIGADLGNVYGRAGRFDESVDQLKKVLALDQNFSLAYWYLGVAYDGKRQYPEAIAALKKAMLLSYNPWNKALLIKALAESGQVEEARRLLSELEAEAQKRYVSSSGLALAYGALGDKDRAFAMLEKEIAERTSRPPLFTVFHLWDILRDDPRFDAIIRKIEQSRLD